MMAGFRYESKKENHTKCYMRWTSKQMPGPGGLYAMIVPLWHWKANMAEVILGLF